ncbi:MAG: hypothetical protein JNM32_06125 [Dechloromonas sp.]|nr:hypothetical protein [Dechloromonas sp.]
MKSLVKFLFSIALFAAAGSATVAGTLADLPLSTRMAVPPNVMFALSVEFPTANTAAYQDTASYSANNQYLGYFDKDKCYSYDTVNGWFYPIALATNRRCTGAAFGFWSGNLLNWATMTGLDEFRFGMTGGNRAQDTATLTVLERTYQSGQGTTANFPNKSFTDAAGNATPFPAGTSLAFQNQGRGVQMLVAPSGSTGVVDCLNPTVVGGSPPISCAFTLLNSTDTAACSSWTGSGTLASPYSCTAFGAFAGVVPTTVAAVAPPSIILAGGGSSSTVSCTSPTLTGGVFDCSLALGNGHTGTCTNWTGAGNSAATPYVCGSFSTFSGGESFLPNGTNTVTSSSFNVTTQKVDPSASTRVSCTVTNSGGTVTTSCPLALSSGNATCTTYSGSGTSASPKVCTSFGFGSGQVYVSSSNSTSSLTSIGGVRYATLYRITYDVTVPTTKYYVSSYSGAAGAGYYYTAAYNVTFSTSQTLNVRVKVCDSSVGLETNCKQFGSAWKPTGVLQDNADKMRFGVSSYFQANDVDNAVLRSKLKYIGPQQFSAVSGLVSNPLTEFSSTDGTLLQNPDSSDSATANSFIGAVSNTGVINYINKFGSASHTYKTYDNVGKLYYETLKYYRHVSPTTAFYQGAKSANADGFPVITQWDDPIQYSCQKNYIIVMGDTHTWCDKRLPGDTHTAANNSVCNSYTDGNGNVHSADYGSLAGDSGVNVATETNLVGTTEGMGNIATSYTGAGSAAGYGMAGLAGWAARSDIRPGATDHAGKQTVQTMVVDVQENRDCGYQSQYWLAAKFGTADAYDTNGNWVSANTVWSQSNTLPAGVCASRAPPGYNTAGGAVTWPKNLLRAGDPQAMISSVQGAIATIISEISDEAALAQSSGNLDTGTGAYLYQALFNTGIWTGEVQALPIDQSGGVAATPAWKANDELPAHGSRHIFTFNDSIRTGVAFDPAAFTTNFSATQQALLDADEFGVTDGRGADRVSYLRGDQSKEAFLPGTTNPNAAGYGWRSRTKLLGDVVNSNPLFVGAPSAGYADPTYRTFALAHANRAPALYVGGNDGMLHAYDASFTIGGTTGLPIATSTSGTEILGYVPSAVYRNLSQLMAAGYSHKFYVDGAPVAVDAYFGGSTGAWKTVLVGGLNAGGQGIYAIDVTSPMITSGGVNVSNFSASNVLWDFTDADDADLGFTFGKPLVRKLNDGNWYVIFGSGYNNTYADGTASGNGRAHLFLLKIEGPGAGNPWVLNTNYYKITVKSPSEGTTPTLPLSPANGLGYVAGIDPDFNETTDFIYGGDRSGNLWKFDLTDDNPANWAVAFGTVASPLPLFTATDASGDAQQVTTGLEVVAHPNGGFMVLFGTGSWIDVTDPLASSQTDSFYGIWDKNDGSTRVSGRSELQRQKVLTNVSLSLDGSGNTVVSSCTYGSTGCLPVYTACQPNYTAASSDSNESDPLCPSDVAYPDGTGIQLGWVFDLQGTGERTRSTVPTLNGGVITFTSLTPTSVDPCTASTTGIEHNLSTRTGGAPPSPVFVLSGHESNYVTLPSGFIPGLTSAIQIVPGGRVLAGGAADNPVGFSARPPSDVVPPVAGLPSPPPPGTSCIADDCSSYGYVSGFGFLFNLVKGSKYVLVCGAGASGGAVSCDWKLKLGNIGRVQWKQIQR